jgi:hypothetical protein
MEIQIALVIVTLILALITFFYLLETKKMAGAMTKELEIRTTPTINVEFNGHSGGGIKGHISFRITNKSNYQVKLIQEKIDYFLEGRKENLLGSFLKNEINNWIYPSENIKRNISYDFLKKGKKIEESKGSTIRVFIKAEYEFENVIGDRNIEKAEQIYRIGNKKELMRIIRNKDKNFLTTRDL